MAGKEATKNPCPIKTPPPSPPPPSTFNLSRQLQTWTGQDTNTSYKMTHLLPLLRHRHQRPRRRLCHDDVCHRLGPKSLMVRSSSRTLLLHAHRVPLDFWNRVSQTPTLSQRADLLRELHGIPDCGWYSKASLDRWFNNRRRSASKHDPLVTVQHTRMYSLYIDRGLYLRTIAIHSISIFPDQNLLPTRRTHKRRPKSGTRDNRRMGSCPQDKSC